MTMRRVVSPQVAPKTIIKGSAMKHRQKKSVRLPVALGIVFAAGALSPSQSWATFSWESEDGLKVDWNNALRYSAMFRVDKRDGELLSNPNLDDGDRYFSTGLISNRGELFSELDLVHSSGFGARVSANGWYDTVYNRDNDNPGVAGGAYPNQLSSGPDEFTDSTRDQHGRNVELRDAFVFGRLQLGGTVAWAKDLARDFHPPGPVAQASG
jgi:hypothetical protein